MESERLSKFLSHKGVASRRKSESIISSGRVKVNGNVVLDPFFRVNPLIDSVTIDGSVVQGESSHLYIALNKPAGYLSDLSDPRGRRLARDLIQSNLRLYPVGRLDFNSEGLMLFTNDGEFANSVMHPRYEIEKEYLVKLTGLLTPNELHRMTLGITLAGEAYKVTSVTEVKRNPGNAWYQIIVSEGKNRMIRRLSEALGHSVIRLKRVRIDGIRLGRLRPGEYREIALDEMRGLVPNNFPSTTRPAR